MVIADTPLSDMLRLLADPTRLRILALLEREELSVGELTKAVGMAQSRVSNHLRILREAEILAERHVGASTYLRLDGRCLEHTPLQRLWLALRGELAGLAEHSADLVRLESVLAERRTRNGDFFDRVAGQWEKIAGQFESGQARLRAVSHLLPAGLVLADLGCGTGYMGEALLGLCDRLICVDRSEKMLEEAQRRLCRAPRQTEVEFRKGELNSLPIADGAADGALAGMVLHHLQEPGTAVAEMFRILRPGGAAAVLELDPHREAWMRAGLGDRHLGLEASDVLAAFRRSGFGDVALDPLADRFQPTRPDGSVASLSLYIVRGRRPRALSIEPTHRS